MTLALLLLCAALFIATHLGISSTSLRPKVVAALGSERAYLGVYSLVSFASIGALIWTYAAATPAQPIWPTLSVIPWLTMPLALFLLIGGFTVPNPTAVEQSGRLSADAAQGMLRITRHPVMWGFLLWALSHAVANGDLPSLVFFLSFAAVAGYGMLLIDRKKAQLPNWPSYESHTSLLPFAAIVSGRNRLVPSELILPAVITVFVYMLMLWLHPWLSGGVAIVAT